jgi:hypothetical protein
MLSPGIIGMIKPSCLALAAMMLIFPSIGWAQRDPLLITPGKSINSLRLGDVKTVNEMVAAAGGDLTRTVQTGNDTYIYYVAVYEVTMRGKGERKSIEVISDLGTADQTPEHIGNGSTAADVVRAYGQPQEQSPELLRYKVRGIAFYLRAGVVSKVEVFRPSMR